jgi:hypothetical protein
MYARRFDWKLAAMTKLNTARSQEQKKTERTRPVRLNQSTLQEIQAEGAKQHRPQVRDQIDHAWQAYKLLLEATGGVDNLDKIREKLTEAYKTKKDAA